MTHPNRKPDAERKQLPKRIYVERWPGDDEDDVIHYHPTGYGIRLGGKGNPEHSRITVYERVPQRKLAAERKAAK